MAPGAYMSAWPPKPKTPFHRRFLVWTHVVGGVSQEYPDADKVDGLVVTIVPDGLLLSARGFFQGLPEHMKPGQRPYVFTFLHTGT